VTNLYGGLLQDTANTPVSVDVWTGNTLNVKDVKALAVGGIANFANLNFWLPADVADGDTILMVAPGDNGGTGVADIRNSTVRVGISGTAAPLAAGEEVILIDADTLLTGTAGADMYTGGLTLAQGVTVEYEIDLLDDDDADGATDGVAKKLVARVRTPGSGGTGGGGTGGGTGGGGSGGGSGSGVVPAGHASAEAKALSEGWLSGLAFLTEASDLAARDGISSALAATRAGQADTAEHLIAFGKLNGGSVRFETGSHVKVEGYGLLAGLAASSGDFTRGGFFEYGEGDASTHNRFARGAVKGKGDVDYRGAGLLAHYRFGDGFWLEGSLRGGRVNTEYRSRDLADVRGVQARYDGDARYASAHAGLGKTWQVGENRLDACAQWLWTRAGGDTVRLSTGERVKFAAAESSRLRAGGRFTRALNPALSGFVGLAWEHEFDGKTKATTHVGAAGYRISAPDMRGDSGMLELGLSTAPSSPFAVEAGIQAWGGQREGVTGGVRMNYRF
jgi:outer membrane autotransporter protein